MGKARKRIGTNSVQRAGVRPAPMRKKAAKRSGPRAETPLDKMQAAYKAAVGEWIAAIKREEALASVNHTIAQVDKWEAAHFAEEDLRSRVKAAKKEYEDALREKFYGF